MAILLSSLKLPKKTLPSIGFIPKDLSHLGYGLALASLCFAFAYALEMAILTIQGAQAHLSIYATVFSLNGQATQHTGLLFILMCLFFNLINVIMEEGVFRGLFLSLLSPDYGFKEANNLSALLFGIWHWVMPLRAYHDGSINLAPALAMALAYSLLAGLMALK